MGVRYSHPPEDGGDGVELFGHLDDVATRVERVVPAEARTPADESLQAVVRTLAYVHDFGKATRFFQQYLGVMDGHPENDRYRYHAPLGSFAAYHALDARGFATETCLAGFVAVAKHHSRLPDVAEYVYERANRREGISPREQNDAERQQSAIGVQMGDIDEHAPDLAERVFRAATDGKGTWAGFRSGFAELLGEIVATVETTDDSAFNRETLSDDCYGLALQCWSALVLADKTGAAGAQADSYGAEKPSAAQLDAYVAELESDTAADPDGRRSEELDHFRSRARGAVLDETESFAAEGGGVATLTLPTGMGKTLTGLSAALDLRDRLGGERVVYSLPFTSIIDQVVDELEGIYDADTAGRLLTAHHHLAETAIRDDDDEDAADLSDDVAGMLAESWRAGLTVTTFVQLFESLAGPGNRQSMKLPALRNSVVILDEPQSLPLDWWKLVPRLVDLLTERYDATVIAMTATQPRLFEDATELVDDPDVYFEATERVRYELDASTERYIAERSGPKPYDTAADDLRTVFDDGDSALAVCNTIDSARELTERLTDAVDVTDVASVYADRLDERDDAEGVEPEAVVDNIRSDGSPAVLHLSTRLRPVDRLTLIEAAKQLAESEIPFVTVSTQLVEAGVDISFDRVYRDLAPVDGVVQAAGRCNRSFERERGRVTVWWLESPGDQQKTPAEAVYNRGPSLLPVAASTLAAVRDDEGDGILSETAVARDAVERYYERLDEEKDVGRQKYADWVDEARADRLAELSLIDRRLAADVVICRTDADRELVEDVREAYDGYEFDRLGGRIDATKPIRVSVPYYREDSETADALRELPRLLPEEAPGEDLRVLDVSRYGSHFDRTTGFVVPERSIDNRFL
jgi:CRISPR-associated endonuclease Cas3-HD